jgi:hypothetical protein
MGIQLVFHKGSISSRNPPNRSPNSAEFVWGRRRIVPFLGASMSTRVPKTVSIF